MARDKQRINDQMFRTRSRNAAEERTASGENQRRRQIRNWIILVTIVVEPLPSSALAFRRQILPAGSGRLGRTTT